MADVHKSVVTLRIRGDMLAPTEVTTILGVKPSFEQIKGQTLINKKTGKERIAKFGMWALKTSDYEPENIEKQVLEIFDKVNSNKETWEYLSTNFDVELFCGIFMKYDNEGMEISPLVLKTLAERGVRLSLDIYAGEDD